MARLDDLKKEVAELEAQAKAQDVKQEERHERPAPAVEPVFEERRSHFSNAQRELAAALGMFGRNFGMRGDGIEDDLRSNLAALSDKLVTMQVVRLMLDDDGNDGIIHNVFGWNRHSSHTLAERMGDYRTNNECNPRFRVGMLSADKQQAYLRKTASVLKLDDKFAQDKLYPHSVCGVERDSRKLCRMSSEQFAEFVLAFHRRVLQWDLKQYIYHNLDTPAAQFFEEFVAMQKQADSGEETVYKGACAAHMLATDPDLGEDEAQGFLDLLRWMADMKNREEGRRAASIAKQKPRTVEATAEAAPGRRAANSKNHSAEDRHRRHRHFEGREIS